MERSDGKQRTETNKEQARRKGKSCNWAYRCMRNVAEMCRRNDHRHREGKESCQIVGRRGRQNGRMEGGAILGRNMTKPAGGYRSKEKKDIR